MEDIQQSKPNPFAVSLIPEDDVTPYSHGIPPDQVEEIKLKKIELDKRMNSGGEAVTLDEFKNIIIPWLRIHRTSEFIINKTAAKEKKVKEPRAPKEPKPPRAPKAPKPPKEKKLTKKEIEKMLNAVIMKKATGMELTEEEQAFFDEQTSMKII